jgi:hypothetical protein
VELGVGVGVAGDVVVVVAAAVDDADARSFRWKSELQKDIVLKIEKKKIKYLRFKVLDETVELYG